jgi:type I restriction enzyme M protein
VLLSTILKDSDYRLSQFREEKIQALEDRIVERKGKYYADCLIRKKEIRLTPEEVIRQLYVMTLLDDLGYPASRMELEYHVSFGREKKRADIVIVDKDLVFSAIYRDYSTKFPYIKRFKIEQFILNKGYTIVPENCTLWRLTTEPEATITVQYLPRPRLKVL